MSWIARKPLRLQPVISTPRANCSIDGESFDVVFEATGVPETITEALPLLRRNGIVVVTGIHARPLALDLTTLVRRQQQLRGSFRPQPIWP